MGTIVLLHKPDLPFQSAIIEPTITATWVKFVQEGEQRAELPLGEELESFLVFTLMRFVDRPDIFSVVLALDFLNATTEYTGKKKEETLSNVGDISLIHAGLFPERAQRLGVSSSYFRDMGRMAFNELADTFQSRKLKALEGLYRQAGDAFPFMEEVLRATRKSTAPHYQNSVLYKY